MKFTGIAIDTKYPIPMFGVRRPLLGYWRGWGFAVAGHRVRLCWSRWRLGYVDHVGGDGGGGLWSAQELNLGPLRIERHLTRTPSPNGD